MAATERGENDEIRGNLVEKDENSAKNGQNSPKLPEIPDFSLKKSEKSQISDLNELDQAGLLELRDQIDRRLTGIRLSDVNLVQETLIQFQKAKILQAKAAATGHKYPLNQLAQVQNSLATILKDLAKIQSTLFDSEQRKRLQAATIKAIKTLPEEAQAKFFEMYEPVLTEAEQVMQQLPEGVTVDDLRLEEEEEPEAGGGDGSFGLS